MFKLDEPDDNFTNEENEEDSTEKINQMISSTDGTQDINSNKHRFLLNKNFDLDKNFLKNNVNQKFLNIEYTADKKNVKITDNEKKNAEKLNTKEKSDESMSDNLNSDKNKTVQDESDNTKKIYKNKNKKLDENKNPESDKKNINQKNTPEISLKPKENINQKDHNDLLEELIKKAKSDKEITTDLKSLKEEYNTKSPKNSKTTNENNTHSNNANKNSLAEFNIDSSKFQVVKENSMEVDRFKSKVRFSKNAGEFLNYVKENIDKSSSGNQKQKGNSSFSNQFNQSNEFDSFQFANKKIDTNSTKDLTKFTRKNINSLVQKAKLFIGKGQTGSVSIHLNPQILGQVHLKLYLKDNKLSARILVETKEAKQMFTKEMNELWKQFEKAGFDLDDFEIDFYQKNNHEFPDEMMSSNSEKQEQLESSNSNDKEIDGLDNDTVQDENSLSGSKNKINIRV